MQTKAIKNFKAAVTAARAELASARLDRERALAVATETDDAVARRRQMAARRTEALGTAYLAGSDAATATASIDEELAQHDAQSAQREQQREQAAAAVTLCDRRIAETVDALHAVSVDQVTTALASARDDVTLKTLKFFEATRALESAAAEYSASARIASALARVLTGRLGDEMHTAAHAIHEMRLPTLHHSGVVVAPAGLSPAGVKAEAIAYDAAVEKLAECGVDLFGTCLARPRPAEVDAEQRPVTVTTHTPGPNGTTRATVARADMSSMH